jgi:hypothetical protein
MLGTPAVQFSDEIFEFVPPTHYGYPLSSNRFGAIQVASLLWNIYQSIDSLG